MSDDRPFDLFDLNEALKANGFEPIGQQEEIEEIEEIKVENINPHKPEMQFNKKRSIFEYKNPALRKIAELRSRLKATGSDPLKGKEDRLKLGLEEIGLSADDLGKTGDSRTGEVSEKHKRVASSQIADYKDTSSNTHKKLQELTPSIKECMDKSTPIKEVSPDMIFNAVYSRKQNKL